MTRGGDVAPHETFDRILNSSARQRGDGEAGAGGGCGVGWGTGMAWGRGGGGPLAAGRRIPPHRHGPDGGPAVHRRPQVVRPGVDGDPSEGDGRRGLDPERGGWWVGGGEPFPSLPSTPASAPLAAMAPPGRSRRRLGRRSPPFPSPSCGLLPSPPLRSKEWIRCALQTFFSISPLGHMPRLPQSSPSVPPN